MSDHDGLSDKARAEQAALEQEAQAAEEAELQGTAARTQAQVKEMRRSEMRKRFEKLELLLRKAEAFSQFLGGRMIAEMVGSDESGRTEQDSRKRASAGRNKDRGSVTKRRRGGGGEEKTGQSGARDEGEEAREDEEGGPGASPAANTLKPADFDTPPTIVGGSLRDYQLYGVKWMVKLFENGMHGILADEMGLGKTVQVICLLAHLRHMKVPGPFLVVAPLSTVPNWISEIKRWAPSLGALLLHGDKDTREEILAERIRPEDRRHWGESLDFPVVVTTYEVAMREAKALSRLEWQYVVVDEGHRLKNMNCRLIKLLKAFPCHNRLLLTGTPLQNSLSELWSLLNFLQPDVFDDFDLFEQWFNFDLLQESGSAEVIAKEREQAIVTKLHRILRPFLLRRVKADVKLALPPKKEVVLYAGTSALQRKYARAIATGEMHALVRAARESSSAVSHGSVQNKVMQLRKACNHPFLVLETKGKGGEWAEGDALVGASGKLRLLDRMLRHLRGAGHKVLIFSQMTRMLDVLEDYLHFRGWEHCRIDGAVDVADRQEAIDKFNGDASDAFVFLLSTRAGGLGINLTGADTVIIYDSDWNPHQDAQAQDRCHRIGQTRRVAVYRLITENSVELKMLRAASNKLKLERLVMRGGYARAAGDVPAAEPASSPSSGGELAKAGGAMKLLSEEELQEVLKDVVEVREGKERGGCGDRELSQILDRDTLFSKDLPRKGEGYEIVEPVRSSLLG